jgi:homoserine kinase type II
VHQEPPRHSPIPRAVAASYDLESPQLLLQFESYGNDNWLIVDGGTRYVLRRQQLNSDSSRIGLQLAYQRHLRAAGVPAAEHVATASGAGYAVDDSGVPWILFRHIEGEPYDFSRMPQAIAAGSCLAQLHRMSESFVAEALSPEYKPPLRECWANAPGEARELGAMLPGAAYASDLRFLQEWWDEVLRDWPVDRLDGLAAGWSHGDFHGRNLVFSDDHIVGLLDFDDVDRGPYAFDLANAMFKFGREGRGSLWTIRPGHVRAFLDGYQSVRTISDEERLALPLLMVAVYAPNAHSYRYWRDVRRDDIGARFGMQITFMKALTAQIERLGEVLTRS